MNKPEYKNVVARFVGNGNEDLAIIQKFSKGYWITFNYLTSPSSLLLFYKTLEEACANVKRLRPHAVEVF